MNQRFCNSAARRHLLALIGLAPLAAAPAQTQPVAPPVAQPRILYGFPPGSAGDVAARRVAERLAGTGYARAAAIVDNRSGAGGRLALEALKAAPADGSVLALAPMSTLALYPHVYRRLGYDPLADFAPVSLVALAHHGLAVGPAVPAAVQDLTTFLAWARAHPEQATLGSPGAGSLPHLLGVLLGQSGGALLRHVPYRGSVPAVTDLVGGQIAALCTPAADLVAQQRAGRLRVLATSGAARLPFLPATPTFAEQGWNELTAEDWFGLCAPARCPPAVLAAAGEAVGAALADRTLAAELEDAGLVARASSAAAMAASLRAEHARWGALVRRSGFSADS